MGSKNLIARDNETPVYTLTSLFKDTPIGVLVIESEENISYANKMAEEILELTQEQLLGKSIRSLKWSYVDAMGQPLPDEMAISSTFQTKKPQINVEYGIVDGGKSKWLRVVTTPILEPDGSISKVLAYLRDITEDHTKQLKLKQSEANLRAVLNLSDHGYILLSAKKEIVMINKLGEKLFHLISANEPKVGSYFPHILPASQKADVEKHLDAALKGDFNSHEHKFKTSQGKEKWLTINYLPSTIKNDHLSPQVIVEIKNITKDRELEHKLDDANEEMVHLMNNSLKSFFIVDEEYKIVQYNKHAENETKQYYGRKPKKNESILPYIPDSYLTQFKQNVHTATQGNRIKEEEERQVAPGLVFYFEQEFFPSINKRSKKNNVGFSSTNITEKKMTRQMLLKSMNELNKYKGAFYEACNVVITDLNGKVSDANDNFCNFFQHSKYQFIGQNIAVVFTQKENKLNELLEELGQSGKLRETVIKGLDKNGKIHDIGLRIYPVKDETGKVVEFIFVNVAG